MAEIEDIVVTTSTISSGVLLSRADSSDLLKGNPKRFGSQNTAKADVPEISLSGLVDAILAVGEQRKVLLDQIRCALVSGKDDEALRFARQLCGLQDEGNDQKSH
jgi:hypothetical protein